MSFFVRYFFLFFPAFLPVQLFALCLHPIEEAALLHGKSRTPTLKDQIRQTGKRLSAVQAKLEKLEDKIADYEVDFKNSLDDVPFNRDNVKRAFNEKYPTNPSRDNGEIQALGSEVKKSAVSGILSYLEGQEDSWDKEGMPWCLRLQMNEDYCEEADEYFRRNGQIEERAFCEEYAGSETKDCKSAIKNLEKYYKELSKLAKIEEELEELISRLEDEQFDRAIGLSSAEDTEANPLCFECLDEVRELDKPTTGQVVGNVLSILVGGAMSYHGYRAGKNEAVALNDLRIRQGYDPVSGSNMSWAGASMGLPFIANGIYGLAGGNSQFGSYACNPGFAGGGQMYSPWAYAGGGFPGMMGGFGGGFPGMMGGFGGVFPGMMGGFGGGFPVMMGGFGGGFPGMMGGFGGGFPGMGGGFGLQFGGGGFPGMMGGFGGGFPGMGGGFGLQFGGGGFPGMMGGFGGGFPGMMGGFGGGFPGMMGGFGGGFPGMMGGFGGGFPGMMGGFGGGFPGMGGGMGASMYQQQYAHYLKYQQQQMQAQMQAQQAWTQHQISIQQDWMQRQQVIGNLTQELYNIQKQIQLVASGGVTAGLSSSASLSAGLQLGNTISGGVSGGNVPSHNPVPYTNDSSGPLPIIEGR